MAKDLRTFLNRLQQTYPQGLITIGADKGMLNPNEYECTALLLQLAKMNKWPTAVFENVATPSGRRWPGRIIFSEISCWPNAAVMVDLDPRKATPTDILEVLHEKGKKPLCRKLVARTDAPVKEIVWQGEEADNLRLPTYRKDNGDARVGWFSGVAVARDLDKDRYNCSWHRIHVHDSKKAAARVNPRHLQEIMNRYKAAGHSEVPVAWVYGHHPAFQMAAGIQVGWDVDEYEYAGALLGEPLRVVPSETLGEDFLVPADAEVVVEGFLHVSEKDINGPWSDFMLYYSPQTLEPVFRTTAVTMRKDPIFSENYIGYDLLPTIGLLALLHLILRQRFPRVKAINYLGPYTFAIQYKPNDPGEVNRLAAFALGGFGDLMKNVIVVDEDIDPFDLSMVFYSIGTRVDAASNRIQVIKDLKANRHDPSAEGNFITGGLIVDSTKPVDKPFPEIGAPPDEVMERMDVHDFLSGDEINRIQSGKN